MDKSYSDVLASLRQRLGTLAEERTKLEHAIEAIEDLAGFSSTPGEQRDLLKADPPASSGKKSSRESPTYIKASKTILEDSGKPTHVRQLIRQAQARGWFADKDPSSRNFFNAMYSALLRRDDLFRRVAPSTFELRRSNPENGSAPTSAETKMGAG